jgi:hypothetical protein
MAVPWAVVSLESSAEGKGLFFPAHYMGLSLGLPYDLGIGFFQSEN